MEFEPININLSEFSENYSNVVSPDMVAGAIEGVGNIAQAFKSNPEAAARRQALKVKKKQCGRIPLIRIGRKAKEKAQNVRDCIAKLDEEERKLSLSLSQKASEREEYKAQSARAMMESARQSARKSEMENKKMVISGLIVGGLLIAGFVGFIIYKKVA